MNRRKLQKIIDEEIIDEEIYTKEYVRIIKHQVEY
jgi:uncharacterized protein YnzC (UPF0291/DUF896 family)